MKNDYTASIQIEEVSIDAATRQVIQEEGLLRLARMSISLTSGGTTVVQPPDPLTINGKRGCLYELLTASKDHLRVVLLDAGDHVYEVRALADEKSGGSGADIFSVQEDLVNSFRW